MKNLFLSIGLILFFSVSALGQNVSPKHAELSGWINRVAHSSDAALTAEDLEELNQIRSWIETEASQIMNENFQRSQMSLNDYRKGDFIPVNLLTIARAMEISEEVAAEDLWHDFILLRTLKLKSQKQAEGYTAHYLSADALAFRKMALMQKTLESRGLQLPFVQMPVLNPPKN